MGKKQKMFFSKNKFSIIITGLLCVGMLGISGIRQTLYSDGDNILDNQSSFSYSSDTLIQSFARPPLEDRPEVFWQWMGGMLSKEGIRKDLEAMAEQGIGGVLVMQLSDQTPNPEQWAFRDYPGKVKCLSDEWFDLVNYAIGEADRLGMTFSIFISPGWSHIGGPVVRPGKGLKQLVAARTEVQGPVSFDGVLSRAPRVVPRNGGLNIPSWLPPDRRQVPRKLPDFYSDVAVIAIPVTKNNETVPITDIKDISEHMDAAGRLRWDVPRGKWNIIRFGVASENGVNHPAPVEATGLEADRMDTSAINLVFNSTIERILREARAKGYRSFKAFETDSYEAGFQDFGLDFRKQFLERRGYDCVAWLPAWLNKKLVIGSPELTKRFCYDMMRTISELTIERTHSKLRQLADERGVKWMTEPYFKLRIDWRTAAARSTMPGSEVWVGKPVERLIGAAPDVAALYGLPIVWAEIFSAESYNSAWRNDPFVLKPYGDAAFCRGINHFFMHGFVHNPFDDRYQPGLTMSYWGTQLGRYLTWWPYASSWHLYLARCQFMLRQGHVINDVLVYPAREEHIPGPAIDAGPFRQVVLNDDALLTRLSVSEGRIVVKDGGSFAALALTPNLELRPEALRKILELVNDGAVLIGQRPLPISASLENYPDCDKEVAALVSKIWGRDSANDTGRYRNITLGRGRVFATTMFSEVLNELTAGPDIKFFSEKDSVVNNLDFIHRRDGNTEIYFVCNTSDQLVNTTAAFRVVDGVPEQWDAVTGERRAFSSWEMKNGFTSLHLRFQPRQSFFIIFRREADLKGLSKVALSPPKLVTDITGQWDVSFDPRWGGPSQVRFEKLEDWTKRKEKNIKYYSGTAIYRTNFDLPSLPVTAEGKPSVYYLQLGTVHNVAQVALNGQDLGIVWCAPWQVKIPDKLLKEGGNKLSVRIANTWVNRLIGDEQEPEDCDLITWDPPTNRKGSYDINIPGHGLKDLPDWFIKDEPRPSKGRFTFTIWRFYDKDAPLLPSGLLGPVLIVSADTDN